MHAAYVDVQLLATGKIKEAAILALANTGVWAQSAGFNANTVTLLLILALSAR